MTRHQRQTWLLTRWAKRNRQAALDAAMAAEEAEQRAARQRVLEAATALLPVVRSATPWRPYGRPEPEPIRDIPLLTRGRAARSRWERPAEPRHGR